MIELLGLMTTILAVAGVLLNNYKLRACFIIWVFSNAISAYCHYEVNVQSLLLRDCIFILLAVHGWKQWKGMNENKTD